MFKKDEQGNWIYDYDLLVAKTNRKFAQEVREIFYIERDCIRLVDVQEGDTCIDVVILSIGLCHELTFEKDTKQQYVSYISAAAVKRINKIQATSTS